MRCTPARVTQKDFLFAFNNDTYFRVKGTSFYFPEKGMSKNLSVYLCTNLPGYPGKEVVFVHEMKRNSHRHLP